MLLSNDVAILGCDMRMDFYAEAARLEDPEVPGAQVGRIEKLPVVVIAAGVGVVQRIRNRADRAPSTNP